ncbi:MAG: GntR family transcriptional regulator [Opitutae bacterium]|jgi:GntR family transcriptional regulator, rspAB operon transcriptional repressor|nr:GntR family transcriptional regulator [Opitutae bacterium]
MAELFNRSVRDQICDTIRSEVLSGAWNNDEPVREQSLADRFGVSRGPIRDVLSKLSNEGLLVYRQNKGVRVNSPPDEAEREFLQSIRRQIEVYSLERCIGNLTTHDDEQIEGFLLDLAVACKNEKIAAIAESDLALHRFLVRHASCEMEAVWLSITSRLFMDYSRLGNYEEILIEHKDIVQAVQQRDLEAANAALIANII